MSRQTTGVLILSADAEDYLPCLQELTRTGVEFKPCATSLSALAEYQGQEILIGQPDLVASVLNDMPEVRWVQSSWAGVTPLLNTGRRDYLLTGVKDLFGPQMAEYVLGYMLARELKIFERHGHQANRNWWEVLSGTLSGRTVGIMGTGSIGSYIARALRPFGVGVSGFSRSGAPVEGFDCVYGLEKLERFLAKPDYLVCVLPDTPGTRHLLDARAFRAMKNHCYLLNIGRGSLIDEPALINALETGELAGAVLDVVEQEPLPPESALWDAPGLIVTGHIAAKSRPEDIAEIFTENYRRYCAGETLEFLVDFERGY
jgi:phosphoglycerate dehydrogenase-like enzyme